MPAIAPEPDADAGAPFCSAAVVKIASRCNLNCGYCYVYNKGDDGWSRQPGIMDPATIDALIGQVERHCRRHGLARFDFVFHGGEPLLARHALFARFVDAARARLAPSVEPRFLMQTNGVLLSERRARELKSLGIGVGISLDVTRASHDRWRVDHRGRGSYDRVVAGLAAARAAGIDPGLLAVIDVAADPDDVFDHLAALAPRAVDFLFPDATWDDPPERLSPHPHADWLLAIFARLVASPQPPFRVRLFDQIARAVLGFPGKLDSLGPGPNTTLVIETDGSIEAIDVLRICGNGTTRTSRNVATDTLDAALRDPLPLAYYHSSMRPSAACAGCAVKPICAGGYLPHRWSRAGGFDNPSVYCGDLRVLIGAVQRWVLGELPDDVRAAAGLRPLAEAVSPPA